MKEARIALTGVAPTPVRASEAEALLVGQKSETKLMAHVTEAVRAAIEPETDLHASSDYRRHLAGALAGRVLAAALQRAGAT
jgi:carbon-monoxide dehydrogenase medium subunit